VIPADAERVTTRVVRCPLCGEAASDNWKTVVSTFRRCTCGLVINCGHPSETYDLDYFTGSDGDPQHRDFDSGLAARYDDARFEPELRMLAVPRSGDRLLDVGSATGAFLTRARSRGWNVLGVEISDAAREIAAGKSIASVPSLDEAGRSAPFAVVTLHHVVEHLEDPIGFLRVLGGLLPSDGRLVIEVPNFGSWDRRAAGTGWVDLRPSQHLWQFTPSTLNRLLEAAGFRVTRVRTFGEPVPTRRSVVQSLGMPTPGRSGPDLTEAGRDDVGFDNYRPGTFTTVGARTADYIASIAKAGKRLQVVATPH
jgi:2-polyprenyl-3-methyl-5-hydroxy-6-metoxy-1,4-benzoquinol methylase